MTLTAEDAAWLLKIGFAAWLFLLMAAVIYRVLVRGQAFHEMLTGPNGQVDPERVGTFAIILIVAGYYALTAANGALVFDEETGTFWMPDIPESLLIILAGGKSAFLAGKISRGLNRRPS